MSKAKNVYVNYGNIVKIEIYDKSDNLKDVAFISKEQENIVNKYQWWIIKCHKRYYAMTYVKNGKHAYMHRIIAEELYGKSEKTVDHLDLNGLNNVNENLRYATNSQQGHNQGMYVTNTSGVKGVTFVKNVKKWRATMTNQSQRYRKDFKTFDEAVEQRKQWEGMFFS